MANQLLPIYLPVMRLSRVLRCVLSLGLLMVAAPPAHAGWTSGGTPVSIGTAAGSAYQDVVAKMQLVSDGSHGVLVVWTNASSVRVQHLDANGDVAPGWPSNGVLACPNHGHPAGQQFYPHAIGDGSGGAIVAWWDTRGENERAFVQHVRSNGSLAWPDSGIALSGPGSVSEVDLAPDAQGGAYVGWAFPSPLSVVRVDSTGAVAPGWTPFGTAICPAAVHAVKPTLVPDGAGGVDVVWSDLREDPSWSIYAIRLGADGSRAAGWPGEGALACLAPNTRSNQSAVPDGQGGVLAVWADTRASLGNLDLYAQRVTAAGNVATGWPANASVVAEGPGDQGSDPPALVADGAGGLLTAWSDTRSGGYDVYASHLDGSGALVGGWTSNGTPICARSLRQFRPVVTGDDTGGAFIAWLDQRNGTDDDIYLNRIDSAGILPPAWPAEGLPVCTATGNQGPVAICGDGTGGAILVWRDARSGNTFAPDIYASHVGGNATVPALVSLIEARVFEGAIHLAWLIASGPAVGDRVQRREPNTGWADMGSAETDGTGRCTIVDEQVEPGHRYGYRLTWEDSGTRPTSDEVWVDVPARPALGIDLRSQTLTESSIVRIRVPDAGSAVLEWLDVHGRRVGSRDLEFASAGTRDVPGKPDGSLPPGLYFLRLRQGTQTATVRAPLLR